MKAFAHVALIAVLLVSSVAGRTKDEAVTRLEQGLPKLMADADVPGLSIALIRGGEVVWTKGFGVRSATTKEPVTDETVFEAASLSKPVFAYAVMKLVDAGKLSLDTPLVTYLPGTYAVGDDARLKLVTARHVLSHTTGFPNWRPRQGDTTLKINFTPGERFSYSGEGFVYLSKVVEHVTGERFEPFMKRTVFDPLGMTSSSYVWQDRYASLKAFNHNMLGAPTEQSRPTEPNAAASLHTTARDYGRFVAAVLKGTGLEKKTARLMLTPQIKVGAGTNSIDRPLGTLSTSVSWGLGWGLESTSAGPAFWHWGDNGDTKAFVTAFEKQRDGFVVFTDSANGLSMIREVVDLAGAGPQPALDWIDYESYKSPSRMLVKSIRDQGVARALADYREWRKGRPTSEVVSESQMNQIGYFVLFGMTKPEEAIEVFKQNVADYPQSYNAYDSLGEAYMVIGNKELAIKNYERVLELNPNSPPIVRETIKKLREMP